MKTKFPDPHAHSRNYFSEHFLVNSSRNFCLYAQEKKIYPFLAHISQKYSVIHIPLQLTFFPLTKSWTWLSNETLSTSLLLAN